MRGQLHSLAVLLLLPTRVCQVHHGFDSLRVAKISHFGHETAGVGWENQNLCRLNVTMDYA